MSRKLILSLLTCVGLATSGFASNGQKSTVGIVNFNTCMTESKIGLQEQAAFESLKNQLGNLLADTEKQINEMAGLFNDPDYMDGLSPEAEEQMKIKFRTLNEEINRYQNQYYQTLQQANMRVVQTMASAIQEAASRVAKEKSLSVVLNKEACFFFTGALDVTQSVVAELNKEFEQNKKSVTADAMEAPQNGKKAK